MKSLCGDWQKDFKLTRTELSTSYRDHRIAAKGETCRGDAFAVDARAEERISQQLIQQNRQIASALPVKQEPLRRRLSFRGRVAVMIDGGNDVATRREIIAQPHHLDRRASGAVRQEHERVFRLLVGNLSAGRDGYRCKDFCVRWAAEDCF